MNLFRALFPYWSFFDRVRFSYELRFREQGSENWEIISFNEKRRLLGLFFNPNINITMAQVNIIEHFVRDIHERQGSVEEFTTYKMLRSLVKFKINKSGTIQFKITAVGHAETTDVFLSDWTSL